MRKLDMLSTLINKIYSPSEEWYKNQIDKLVYDNAVIKGKPNNTAFSYKGFRYKAKLSTHHANTISLDKSLHDKFEKLLSTYKDIQFEKGEIATILRSIFNSSDNTAHLIYLLPEHLHQYFKGETIRRNPREIEKDTNAEDYIYLKDKTKQRLMLNSLLD
jgi:hypothetical protein